MRRPVTTKPKSMATQLPLLVQPRASLDPSVREAAVAVLARLLLEAAAAPSESEVDDDTP